MSEQVPVGEFLRYLEEVAPSALQESYDNAGLQVGDPRQPVTSVLVALDVTPAVLEEALATGANLIVAHHPLIFHPLKRITGASWTEQLVASALRHQISVIAVHTNLDNVEIGVNRQIADRLGLRQCTVLQPARGKLRKLVTFVPEAQLEKVREALFEAGAGVIGRYDKCSFNAGGYGTFRGAAGTHPFAGQPEKLHREAEVRLETIFPVWLETRVVEALLNAHPYEEVAYDLYPLENHHPGVGAGMAGTLPEPMEESRFLELLKKIFGIPVIRHSPLTGNPVSKVALCGGAGAFLLKEAIASGAGFFLTGDIRYHQFFDAQGKTVLADIGHFESEQFTRQLFCDLLAEKFHTFAVRLSGVNTNPVRYYF